MVYINQCTVIAVDTLLAKITSTTAGLIPITELRISINWVRSGSYDPQEGGCQGKSIKVMHGICGGFANNNLN
jgi:hypothetical protein